MSRRRSVRSLAIVALALLGALLSTACALRSPGTAPADPDLRARRAADALAVDAFTVARHELQWLAARCESGAHGRRALLLLAAAELDPQNPRGSPHAAARAAANYLLLPDADPNDVLLARALYRLAVDLGATPGEIGGVYPTGDTPLLAGRFDTCEDGALVDATGSLPSTPSETTAERMAAMEARLAGSLDSLEAHQARIAELEAEIQRITALLREGVGTARAPGRR